MSGILSDIHEAVEELRPDAHGQYPKLWEVLQHEVSAVWDVVSEQLRPDASRFRILDVLTGGGSEFGVKADELQKQPSQRSAG